MMYMIRIKGSPPHTRRIPKLSASNADSPRITPAYAENTRWNEFRGYGLQDHPRIRGEYKKKQMGLELELGSPPHTRRIPGDGVGRVLGLGITPAYAENT